MDKVKVTLALLKKHHFWVLFVAILAVTLLSWSKATSDMAAEFNKRKGQIESETNSVRSISADPKHPNEKTIKEIQAKQGVSQDPAFPNDPKNLVNNVLAAWTRVYEDERRDNPLPRIYEQEGEKLQREFEEEFGKRWGPLEALEKLPPEKEIPEKYRDRYLNHIQNYVPHLYEIIDRRREVTDEGTAAADARRAAPGGPGGETKTTHLEGTVDWNDTDAKRIEARLSLGSTTPTTLDVMLAQEDLWVYEALLRVIRNTNNMSPDRTKYLPPDNHKVARVKQITALQIGKEAAQAWQKADQTVIPLGGGGLGPGAPPAQPTMGGPGGRSDKPTLLAGRYVDDKGKELADPTQQPYAEFRMMPVNLQVIMEQRAIPKLLAECANSNMPIEVRAVRMLATESKPFDAGSTEGLRTTAGGFGAAPGGAAHGAMAAAGAMDEESIDPMVPPVPVEIRGLIYIYNPPDRAKLGTGTTGGSVAAAGGAAPPGAAPPAAMPAAPAAKGGQR
jgi:hypothetical protein